MRDDIIIETFDLTKDFGRHRVVDHLDLEVHRGDVFGFLGPNGAGKTTTIRMLVGLIKPTRGRAEILGYDIQRNYIKAINKVGALVETPQFYEYLSGRENLRILGTMSGGVDDKRIDEILDLVDLLDRGKDKVRKYSHGMKQRLGIAQALLSKPELIILDEPTSGLDPQGMKEIRDLIKNLTEMEQLTIFISSHLLHEVEQICNRVAIINLGKLITQRGIDKLFEGEEEIIKVRVSDREEALALLREQDWIENVRLNEQNLEVRIGASKIADMNALLVQNGFKVSALIPERGTLEDYYIKIMEKENDAQSH